MRPLERASRKIFARETADRLGKQLLFVGEFKIHDG
jgi:hypothetical protein